MRITLTLFLMCLNLLVFAQKRVFNTPKSDTTYVYNEAYLWEAYPTNGNIIFGVAQSENEVEETLEKFIKNNQGGAIVPMHKIIKKEIITDPNFFEIFDSYCPRGYRILKLIDISALRILTYDGLRNAAVFYSKKSEKNYGESMEYLSNLHNKFKPYRFKEDAYYSNIVK